MKIEEMGKQDFYNFPSTTSYKTILTPNRTVVNINKQNSPSRTHGEECVCGGEEGRQDEVFL